ncbi:MAG: hypothetical protein HC804_11755 [Anaerolineae bacterium]|nr:hypothetical protein [Anaerolineae bacterium]
MWDILLAVFLLVVGLSFLSDQFYILAILLLLAAPFMWEAKKRVTVSRLPSLCYSPAQLAADERRKHIILEVATAVLFVGILLFTAVTTDPHLVAWLWPINGFALGIFLALAAGLVGYLYRALNWAVYAFLLMVLTFASVGFGLSFAWVYAVCWLTNPDIRSGNIFSFFAPPSPTRHYAFFMIKLKVVCGYNKTQCQ